MCMFVYGDKEHKIYKKNNKSGVFLSITVIIIIPTNSRRFAYYLWKYYYFINDPSFHFTSS